MEYGEKFAPITLKADDARRIADLFERIDALPWKELKRYMFDPWREEYDIMARICWTFRRYAEYIEPETIAPVNIPEQMFQCVWHTLYDLLEDRDKKQDLEAFMPEGSTVEDFRKLWAWLDQYGFIAGLDI